MRIEIVGSTNFTSKMIVVDKASQLLAGNKKNIGIKPIKNYTQYIKEYGLDLKPGKK